MINMAYIVFIQETGGGYDDSGNPIASTKTKSNPIPCNLEVVSRQYVIVVDGQQQQASYSAIVDVERLSAIDVQTCKSIELQDYFKNSLGTYQLQNKEYLRFTNRWKFVV